jgi:60 kDa SS-A/Ro ribonucleoprotein
MVAMAAARLEDEKLIARSRVFPYQLLAAYLNVSDEMPARIKNALQVAMGKALDNVPTFDGGVDVLVDTSGSMKNSVTGRRDGATSKIRCVDVAAVFASAVLRKNPEALVVPFDTRVHEASLNAFDSVMTNAEKLARHGGGGTRCAIAMAELNRRQSKSELVVYVSDNESWVGSQSGRGTETMAEWLKYKKRVPRAKLVCIDITPNGTTQAVGHDVLNVGGFSDEVFKVVSLFAQGKLGREHWVGEINKVELHCDAAEVKAA